MSYDLLFWRQSEVDTRRPQEILDLLAESGGPIDGLLGLEIDSFLADVLEAFPAAVREPNGPGEWIVWDPPDQRQMFEAMWSQQHVWVTLRGPWTNETANRLIGIAHRHGCPLYDPQSGERFG